MHLSSLLGHTQELLGIIRNSRKPADSLIDSFFRSRKYLGSHDRRFIAETTYGTLRHLRLCEARLDDALQDPGDVSGEDRLLLTVASYLLHQGAKIDMKPDILSPKIHSDSLKLSLPSVLERLGNSVSEDGPDLDRFGIHYSFPDWMINRFVAQFGPEETARLCESLNHPAPLNLRVNLLKTTVEECQEKLAAEGVETTKTPRSPFGLLVPKRINMFALQSFRNGLFEVQDEGSQLLPLLLDPKPTWKILDACAGAGGKSLEFAALMKNRGEVFATDVHVFRLDELRKRMRRAGAFNIRVSLVDALSSYHPWTESYFDAVFVDAPCSGIGTIRRNPGLKWMVSESDVTELQEKQLHILNANASYLKPGGSLVYATCSLLKEENEDVVGRFLLSHSDFSLENIGSLAGKAGLGDAVEGSFLRLQPHRHGTDGFFCAVLLKRSEE